jgi:hypothetical protein
MSFKDLKLFDLLKKCDDISSHRSSSESLCKQDYDHIFPQEVHDAL